MLVRECVATWVGGAVADVVVEQRCDACGGRDHGRPFVRGRPDVHVSLAHTRGHVAAVAAASPCGVDVEGRLDQPLPADVIAPAEVAWLSGQDDPATAGARLWVRKEALVKAGVVAGVAVHDWRPDVAVAAWAVQESPRYDFPPVLRP